MRVELLAPDTVAKEVSRVILNVAIDGFVRRGEAAVDGVRGSVTEEGVQSLSHFGPDALVVRRQKGADFRSAIESA